MNKPLDGIRVLELASYAMVPLAATMMADWGASVIKIEQPQFGDALRRTTAWNIPATEGCSSYLFAIANRGKRSIALDIATAEGRGIFDDLLRQADVFLTNFLPQVQAKLRIRPDDLWQINPKVVIGRGSGYGPHGEEAGKAGFDGAVFWSGTGMAQAITPPDLPPLRMAGPATGDSQCAVALCSGVLAALVQLSRTGKPEVVDSSLLGNGMWIMQGSYAGLASADRDTFIYPERLERADNPLTFPYRTSDGRYVHISLLDSEKYWPGLCDAIDRLDLLLDPRFEGPANRSANRAALVSLLDEIFGAKPLAYWVEALARQSGPWSIVKTPGEAARDPQALANNYVQTVPWENGRTLPMVPAPAQFGMQSPQLAEGAPTLGRDTDEVLGEIGRTEEEIAALRSGGVIG